MILDDLKEPRWYPIELFTVSCPEVPSSWLFRFEEKPHDMLAPRAFWGYPSLVNDLSHHDALVNRKREALRAFVNEVDRTNLLPNEMHKIANLTSRLARTGPALDG